MTITNRVTNTFRCDLRKPDGSFECDVEFDYNPAPPPTEQWPAAVQIALMKVVQVSHPLTAGGSQTAPPNPPRFYCSDEHAMEGIKRKQHLPALPPKIVPASSDAEVKAAAAGARAVSEMKGPRVKPS